MPSSLPYRKPILNFNYRLKFMKAEAAFDYLRIIKKLEAEGKDVISFGIGQPDFDTPLNIKEAAKKAIDSGFTGYTDAIGMYELRETVAEYVNNRYGTDVKPEEVAITVGSKAAITYAILGFLKRGDEAIILDPGFPVYEELVKFAGGRPVHIQLKEENDFALTAEQIEEKITSKTKLLILNNPENPTGGLIETKELEEILEIARKHKIVVISDEIYDHYVYEGRFETVLIDPEWRSFVICVNGVSKTYSMTGWRIGWAIANKKVIERFRVFAANTTSCPTSISQIATIEALRGPQDEVEKRILVFKRRRDILVNELSKISGFKVIKPKGTFFMFPNLGKMLNNMGMYIEEFSIKLAYKKNVIILPGTAFSSNNKWSKYARFAFTIDVNKIKEGVKRIKEFIEETT